MGGENKHGLMGRNMRGIMRMIKRRDWASSITWMGVVTMVVGRMICSMGRGKLEIGMGRY